MRKINAVIACAGVVLLSQVVLADEGNFQKTEQLTLEAQSLSTLVIEAGAGSMQVIAADVDGIRVSAKIYQQQPHDNYCLSLTRKNNKALLESAVCRDNKYSNEDTAIDLTIQVPRALALEISDGSGFIEINGASAVKIVDGSGYIDIDDIQGAVDIHDGSGLITAKNIDNNIDITDGSGAIELVSIKGDVVINDGSGAIDVSSIVGDVAINDGSGSISVRGAHRFELLSDGSGQVDVSNISGEVIMNGHGH